MPNITVEGPAIKDLDKKRKLVSGITDLVSETFSFIPREAIVVVIKENSPENVSVGGELIIDRKCEKK